MATNGNSIINGHKNGNGNNMLRSAAAESLGFGVAEGVSMVTSLGVVAIADQLIPKPILAHAYHAVGKVLEPWLLDPFEWAKHKFCKLEECKVDNTKSRQERAEEMAKIILVFGAAWAISMRMKLRTRRFMNNQFNLHEPAHPMPENASLVRKAFNVVVPWDKMNPQERMIFSADEGVHYGSIILMNNQMAPATDEMIRSATRIIHKVTGFDEKKSHEIADMLVIWEMPNFLGMLSGFGAIIGKHAWKWPEKLPGIGKIFSLPNGKSHVDKLTESTSLSGHTPVL